MYDKQKLASLEGLDGVIPIESNTFSDTVYIVDKRTKALHLCVNGLEVAVKIKHIPDMFAEILQVLDMYEPAKSF